MTQKLVKKSVTTTMEMLNTTIMGRAQGLEVGLEYCLRDVPDATHVEITAYKWVDDTPLESGAPPISVVPEAIVGIEESIYDDPDYRLPTGPVSVPTGDE